MTARTNGARFRQRKLSTKQNLPVLRESDVEKLIDDEATRHIPKVETGVEKAEEIEHHLQAVISAQAAGAAIKASQLYIPTPDAVASKLQYEDLYPRHFTQPATYIRFSSTVEDTIGCPYCLDDEDAAFLKTYNQRKNKLTQCSEDDFESVMNFFEQTAAKKQPFAAVDNPPVLTFEELEPEFDETVSDSARRFAKDIYAHWKNRRLLSGNRSLMPDLKFETNHELDDADPYVCFRRREYRQTRKTRGRDAQVVEKLKKMRKELEEARFLVSQVKRRETFIRDQLVIDRQIFDQRTGLKEIKRKLGIKADDEDLLINQKPAPKPKPKVDTHQAVQRGIPGMGPKAQLTRPDGRHWDSDLVFLEDQRAKKAEAIEAFVEDNLLKHQKWNVGWVDKTWRPITPPLEQQTSKPSFRPVFTSSQLPTPPGSENSDTPDASIRAANALSNRLETNRVQTRQNAKIRFSAAPEDIPYKDQPRYRCRTGRGGRMMVDRRGIKRQKLETIDERVADRFKYSGESSEDEEVYPVDWTDNLHIRYRIMISQAGEKPNQHAQQAAAQRRAIAEAAHNRIAPGQSAPAAANT